MFTISAVADPLTQGDLFDDCPLVSLSSVQFRSRKQLSICATSIPCRASCWSN
jgi:hypothetical protein